MSFTKRWLGKSGCLKHDLRGFLALLMGLLVGAIGGGGQFTGHSFANSSLVLCCSKGSWSERGFGNNWSG